MDKKQIVKLIDESVLCLDLIRLENGYMSTTQVSHSIADFVLDLLNGRSPPILLLDAKCDEKHPIKPTSKKVKVHKKEVYHE